MGTSAIKKCLLKSIEEQREWSLSLLEKQSAILKGARAYRTPLPKTQVVIHLESTNPEVPHSYSVDVGHITSGLISSVLAHVPRHHSKAISASNTKNIADMYNHVLEAQVCCARADAFAFMGELGTMIAKAKATKSHPETEPMRAKVVAYWRKHCDPKKSAAKAANDLVEKFVWKNGNPVGHRKLAAWISQAIREDRGPSKVT
jgi:hypothetical protein